MRKRGARKGQWIFWVVALFGWFAPAGVLATSENLLVNGDFATDGGGWSEQVEAVPAPMAFPVLEFGMVNRNSLLVICKILYLSKSLFRLHQH